VSEPLKPPIAQQAQYITDQTSGSATANVRTFCQAGLVFIVADNRGRTQPSPAFFRP